MSHLEDLKEIGKQAIYEYMKIFDTEGQAKALGIYSVIEEFLDQQTS